MMSLQPFSSPPRWLPLRLLLGGLVAGGFVLLFHHHDSSSAEPMSGVWARCGSSLIVLVIGLLLALCVGLVVGLGARQMGPRTEKLIALLGRALACVPVVALAWGFISGWIGHLGWPVESLMPAQFPDSQGSWHVALARALWEFLAPALILALPLCGEMIHAVIVDGRATLDLDFSLRARGVPKASRIWFHHLSQLLPLLRVRLQSLCLMAPVYLIIVEDTLHFMGWGGGLAQSVRAGEASGVAFGFVSGGAMMALLCAGLHLLRGRLKFTHGFVSALAWQPWLLWALGALALLPVSSQLWIMLWMAVLASGSAGWHQAWSHIEEELPIEAARVFGASEKMIWRLHIARLQFCMLTAWLCTVFAQTLLCIAAACALQPRLIEALGAPLAKIYRPLAIASVQDAAQTLADPRALLQSGGGIALAALCLIQVSRIVQPRNL
jgi:ABC-type dipeptide/oligopeptide/nickel transport system permease component